MAPVAEVQMNKVIVDEIVAITDARYYEQIPDPRQKL